MALYSFPSAQNPSILGSTRTFRVSTVLFFPCRGTEVLKVWSMDQHGNLLEMQILEPHARPAESEILRWGPEICVLISPPGDCDVQSRSRTTALLQDYLNKMVENLTNVDILWKGNSSSSLWCAFWPHQDFVPSGWHRPLLLQHFHIHSEIKLFSSFLSHPEMSAWGFVSSTSGCPYQLLWIWQQALCKPSTLWPPSKEYLLFVFKDPRCTELDES